MKKNYLSKRILAFALILVMMLGMLPMTALADSPDAATTDTVEIFISFEGFSLGQGFFIEPARLTMPQGSTLADATAVFLGQNSTAFVTTAQNNFLDRVAFGVQNVTFPPFLEGNEFIHGELLGQPGWLGAFDFSAQSGWMYTHNHVITALGMAETVLRDADVFRWQFSLVGQGADLGAPAPGWSGHTPLFYQVDKTALIRALYSDGASAVAVQNALDVIIDPLASEEAVAAALYALTGDDGGNGGANADSYAGGWFTVHNPGGELRDRLLALVDEAYGLPPLNLTGVANTDIPMIRTRLQPVQRLRVVGHMDSTDFRPGGATATIFATGLLAQNGNFGLTISGPPPFPPGQPDPRITAPALLASLVELDLAGVTSITNQGAEELTAFPVRAMRGLRNLERVRLPQHFGLSNGIFQFNINLNTLTFGNAPFTYNTLDFRGLNSMVFTGSHQFEHAAPSEIIFPEGLQNIPNNMFASNFNLQAVHFYGATAPTLGTNIFLNVEPRPIAVVPDNTTGGYELPAFFGVFLNVDSRDVQGVNRSVLNTIILEARALNAGDFTPESWEVFAAALSAAEEIMLSATSQQPLDDAAVALRGAIEALEIRDGNVTFIDVPAGAVVGVFRKGNHFTAFQRFPMSLDEERSGSGRDVWRAALPTGANLHLEAYILGETVKHARFFSLSSHGTTITVNPTPLSDWSRDDSQPWQDNNVLTNLDDSGTVNLEPGGVFYLDTFRVWQAMAGLTENYFIEPVYRFELSGSSAEIERAGSPGRERLRITGLQPGVSVIKITYDPIEYVTPQGTLRFNAMDERNTLAVVVNVGGGPAFNTGISIRNDFDTYFFDAEKGSREFTFTPAAGSSVRVHAPLNISPWGEGWSEYTADAGGSFTVTLREGRNIIQIDNGSSRRFHVVKALGVSVTVVNATNPGMPFEVGDTARVSITGMPEPIEKLAGIYNPGFSGGWGASDMRTFIRLANAGGFEVDSNRAIQYRALGTIFTVEYQLTDASLNVLTGHIHAGVMGDAPGFHRNIPLSGVTDNMTATDSGPFAFGALPVIILPLAEKEIPVDKTELDALISAASAREAVNYTAQTWVPLVIALENAVAVRYNADVSQEQVDLAVSMLQAAMDGLVEAPAVSDPIDEVLRSVLDWVYGEVRRVGGPSVEVIGGEWAVLALARAGRIHLTDWKYVYTNNLRAHIAGYATVLSQTAPRPVIFDGNRPTENQRAIIALTALGLDASNFEGYDLVTPLKDFDWVRVQGNNAVAFALIALDTVGYLEGQPDDPRARLVSELTSLQNQNANGSWGVTRGGAGDHSMTAMVITALAPYYNTNADVRAAVGRALNWLSAEQSSDGRIGNDSQNISQAIVALTALGRNPVQDAQFIKNGNTLVDGLLSFRVTGGVNAGAFGNISSAAANAMSTEQAAYALVALQRFEAGQTHLYDMRDVPTGGETPAEVDRSALSAAIASVPAAQGNFTDESWAAVQAALASALATWGDVDAVQAQVNSAASALNAAIAGLTEATRPGQPQQPGQPGPTQPSTVTVTFSLFGASQHDGSPTYIWRTSRARFQTWIPARTITFNTSEVTVYDVFTRALREAGFEARITSRGNYVSAINGPGGWLGEFDNGPNSGWMYMVNGVHVSLGLAEQVLRDGDVVLWHFTDDFTREAGSENWGGAPGGAPGGAAGTPEEDEDDEDEDEALGAVFSGIDISAADLEAWENPFEDINYGDWFFEAVRFVNALELMTGTDNGFEPNMYLTRAMLITILARVAGADTSSGATWYSQAVAWGVEMGITDGTNLRSNITREQLATMLYRFAALAGMDTEASAELTAFRDANEVSYWAQPAKMWAVETGIIQGRTPQLIVPAGTATRAEAAVMLMRFLTK